MSLFFFHFSSREIYDLWSKHGSELSAWPETSGFGLGSVAVFAREAKVSWGLGYASGIRVYETARMITLE